MRVFSQIDTSKRQFNQKPTIKSLNSNHIDYNYRQKHPSIIPVHDTSQQNVLNQKNSDQYLRSESEEFLERNRQRYSSIINLPSHIKQEDQFKDEQEKTAKKDQKNIIKRQKIFQQSPFEPTKQKNLKQFEQTQTVKIGQSPKSIALRLLRSNSPINQMQQFKINNSQKQTNPNIQRSNLQYRKKKITEQSHESINYQDMPNRQIERQSQIESIVIAYPNLVQRLETNEKEISLLRQKLNAKINNDAEKERYFYQTQNHRSNDAQIYLQNMKFKKQKTNYLGKQRQCLDMKQTIKMEQLKRKNKEMTNNYTHDNSIVEQQQQKEYMIIQNRIQQLKRMRRLQSQSIANSKTEKYNSIDGSIRPQFFQTNKWKNKKFEQCKMIQSVQLFDNNKTISNSPFNYKQAKNKLAQISETVPISKIY